VCDFYNNFQSCCCAEETTKYRQCLFDENAAMLGVVGCTDSCRGSDGNKAVQKDGGSGGSIITAVVVVMVLAGFAGFFLYRRRKQARDETLPTVARKETSKISWLCSKLNINKNISKSNPADSSDDASTWFSFLWSSPPKIKKRGTMKTVRADVECSDDDSGSNDSGSDDHSDDGTSDDEPRDNYKSIHTRKSYKSYGDMSHHTNNIAVPDEDTIASVVNSYEQFKMVRDS
jgi:hypothetical protein